MVKRFGSAGRDESVLSGRGVNRLDKKLQRNKRWKTSMVELMLH